MGDSPRTFAQIQAAIVDNDFDDVSPQDVRDFAITMRVARAGVYISSSAPTSIAEANEWTAIAGTFTKTSDNRFAVSGGALTYSGTPTVDAHAVLTASTTAAAAGKSFEVGLAKNGSVVASSIIDAGSGDGPVSTQLDTSLVTDDDLKVYVRNLTDDTDITFDRATLIVDTFMAE